MDRIPPERQQIHSGFLQALWVVNSVNFVPVNSGIFPVKLWWWRESLERQSIKTSTIQGTDTLYISHQPGEKGKNRHPQKVPWLASRWICDPSQLYNQTFITFGLQPFVPLGHPTSQPTSRPHLPTSSEEKREVCPATIGCQGVLVTVGWWGKYTWKYGSIQYLDLFGHILDNVGRNVWDTQVKPLIYVRIIWFGLWECLGNQLLSHVPGRISIRICITGVPGYVKWMWRNQNCFHTTEVSWAYQEHVCLNQWSSMSSVWLCLYVLLLPCEEMLLNPTNNRIPKG